jgi:hypothetical protein
MAAESEIDEAIRGENCGLHGKHERSGMSEDLVVGIPLLFRAIHMRRRGTPSFAFAGSFEQFTIC